MKNNIITINEDILKIIALNPKIQRSDLRIYMFLMGLDRPVYQRQLIALSKEFWNDIDKNWLGEENIKPVGDFRAEVISRSIKNLMEFNLVKVVKQEGNNKFIEVEKDISKILNKED